MSIDSSMNECSTRRSSLGLAINLVAFYLCWFACVLGAARGYPWAGPAAVAVWIPLHLQSHACWRRELAFLFGAAVMGYLTDSALVLGGVLDFGSRGVGLWPAPLWMVALWLSFATTFGGAMSWLAGRYYTAGIFGLIGGPAAYLAGAKLGAVTFGVSVPIAVALVGLQWLIAMPLLLKMRERIVWP